MRLNEYFKKRHVKVYYWCKDAGVSYHSIWHFLTKSANLKFETAYKILLATNGEVTLDDLFAEYIDLKKNQQKEEKLSKKAKKQQEAESLLDRSNTERTETTTPTTLCA